MSIWASLRERGRGLLFGRSEDLEVDEELRFHLDKETEKNINEGLSPEEARRRALIAFGGVERCTEQVREARGAFWIENAVRDVRWAARLLKREPGFAMAVIVSLSVGIGATAAVFALANW